MSGEDLVTIPREWLRFLIASADIDHLDVEEDEELDRIVAFEESGASSVILTGRPHPDR